MTSSIRRRRTRIMAGDKYRFLCPVCEHGRADATYRINHETGQPEWFVGCFTASCKALGGTYLKALAENIGAASGAHIKEDPLRWLSPLIDCPTARNAQHRKPGDLPSIVSAAAWSAELEANVEALNYLTEKRGLSFETIRRARIGYAPPGVTDMQWGGFGAFTIPIYANGQLINLRRKFWPKTPTDRTRKPVKYIGLPHRSAAIYPNIPPGRALLLCEGEFDALLARQHGLPAVTSTAGTSWSHSWNRYLPRRRVAVLYDTGAHSYQLACHRATTLAKAGATDAWAVDLRQAGLDGGEDLTDWFVTYRFSARKLIRLIRSARQEAN